MKKSLNYSDKIRSLDLSTTIVIMTKNNEDCILYTLQMMNKTMRQHKNLRKVIIIDQNSKDLTTQIILKYIQQKKDQKILLITTNRPSTNTRIMKKMLPYLNTSNTIFIEPQLYTYPRQIIRKVEQLRKCHVIIPNRLHKHSFLILKQIKEKIEIRKQNNKYDKRIKDPTNTFKGFRTIILKYLISQANTKSDFWKQAYDIILKEKLTISQPSVDYCTKKGTVFKNFNYKVFLKKE